MSKKFLLVMAILTVMAFGFYGYLGGFNSPDIAVVTSAPITVAGKYYEGPLDNDKFTQLFPEIAQAREKKVLDGTLTNIYYNNPEDQTDSIKAFIGVAVKATPATLPQGYEVRQVPGGKRIVRVSSDVHYLLAPNKLYPALFEYLQSQKLKVKNQYLEKFPVKAPAVVEAELIP